MKICEQVREECVLRQSVAFSLIPGLLCHVIMTASLCSVKVNPFQVLR